MEMHPDSPLEIQTLELGLLTTLLNHAEQGAWVFALSNTVAVRDETVKRLEERLTIPCYEFTFSPQERNPLHYLDTLPLEARKERAAIFFFDIERAFPEVLGYLDLNREWFLRQPHALVFWISDYARGELARRAPNFWSRRHAVFDFSLRDRKPLQMLRGEMAGGDARYEDVEEWTRKLRLYRGLLDEYRSEDNKEWESIAGLHNKIARLHYRRGNYNQAEKHFKKELDIREQLGDQAGLAASYNNIAFIHQERGELPPAAAYFEKNLAILEAIGARANAKTVRDNLKILQRMDEGNE